MPVNCSPIQLSGLNATPLTEFRRARVSFFVSLSEAISSFRGLSQIGHVVNGATRARLHLHVGPQDAPNSPRSNFAVEVHEFQKGWIPHPDPTVDLCVGLVGPMFHTIKEQHGHDVFYVSLGPELLLNDDERQELLAVEDILMVGYPNGIWDSVNNMPIVRRGTTATHPNLDYEGRAEFMIDVACFPGSSGSPVLLYNNGAYATRNGAMIGGTRIKLLGILYAGPQHTAAGELVIANIPTIAKPLAISRIPNNLGVAIKSDRLREFEPLILTRTNAVQTS